MADSEKQYVKEMYRFLLIQKMKSTKLLHIAEETEISSAALSEFRRKGYLGPDRVKELRKWFVKQGVLEPDEDPGASYKSLLETLHKCWVWLRDAANVSLTQAALDTGVENATLVEWESDHKRLLLADEAISVLEQCIEWANPENANIPGDLQVHQLSIYADLLDFKYPEVKTKNFSLLRAQYKPLMNAETAAAFTKQRDLNKGRIRRIDLSEEELRILQMFRGLNESQKLTFEKTLRNEYLNTKEGTLAENVEVFVQQTSSDSELDNESR